MATPPGSPQVELRQPLVLLQGTGYGMRQPIALGMLAFRLGVATDSRPLQRIFGGQRDDRNERARAPQAPERALAAWLLERAVAMQRDARIPVFDPPQVHRVEHAADGTALVRFVIPWTNAGVTRSLLQALAHIFSLGLDPRSGKADDALTDRLRAEVDRVQRALRRLAVPGTNTLRFLAAAHANRIPFAPVVANVFRFGDGAQGRWLDSSFTDRTPTISTQIARFKHMTSKVLRDHGFPVPEHALAKDAADAVAIADRLGYPVVVKPADKDGGVGVVAGLSDPAAVSAAYEAARRASPHVLVERHVHGDDHRLTIFQGRMIKAVRRIPGGVTGDGRQTVAELIDRINADPVRVRRNASRGRTLLCLDDEALSMLAQRGLDGSHVPAEGEFIALRRRANVSTGGEPVLVTGAVHPDNRRLAERAATTLRLDMAGVDLIIPDISRSWLETDAGICEVNSQPQIGEASTPEIYARILLDLLPQPRIPIALVLTSDRSPMGGALAAGLRTEMGERGLESRIAAHDGAWDADGAQLCEAGSAFRCARAMIGSTQCEALIVVADPAEILRHGLPFERCLALFLDSEGHGATDSRTLQRALSMAVPNVDRVVIAPAAHSAMPWLEKYLRGDRLRRVAADTDAALRTRMIHAARPELDGFAGATATPT